MLAYGGDADDTIRVDLFSILQMKIITVPKNIVR